MKVTFKELADRLAERIKTPDVSMHVAALAAKDLTRAILRINGDVTDIPMDYTWDAHEVRLTREAIAYQLLRAEDGP